MAYPKQKPYTLLLVNQTACPSTKRKQITNTYDMPDIVIQEPRWEAREVGSCIWPILAKGMGEGNELMGCDGYIHIKTLTGTPKFTLLHIKPIDIISICLGNPNATLKEHFAFELDRSHQFIRCKNRISSAEHNAKPLRNEFVIAELNSAATNSQRMLNSRTPRYGPRYGPEAIKNKRSKLNY